ncbi:photosystem II protein Psb27 [Crocosphaera sp.]|uniref:photosystem II protein Psb27 n=1 Tax=Crocosphaera sp. TaxID=2729996 RepID=UPI002621E28F|nr:photosystem II protein Psb27 [Crocosphaera sp.]MDJ0582875.1 photosystem II protein Psb27 [Crocosphaera sp.]
MFFKSALSRILALVLVAVVTLTGCGNDSGVLSGNYSEDTLTVIETLTTAINLSDDAENKQEIQSLAKEQINDYISRYRRNGESGGLRSFTTMQTALNSLAGYYTSYGSRPLPEKLKKRLKQEFKQAEVAIKRGI